MPEQHRAGQLVDSNILRQDPSSYQVSNLWSKLLKFVFAWKLLEKHEKWHHFCAHAQWWPPWRLKCRKKAPCFVKFKFLTNRHRQKQFLQNERRRADLWNFASDFLIFAPGHKSVTASNISIKLGTVNDLFIMLMATKRWIQCEHDWTFRDGQFLCTTL